MKLRCLSRHPLRLSRRRWDREHMEARRDRQQQVGALTPYPRAGGCSAAGRGTSRRLPLPPSFPPPQRQGQGTQSHISGAAPLMPPAPVPEAERGCAVSPVPAPVVTAAISARRRSGCQLEDLQVAHLPVVGHCVAMRTKMRVPQCVNNVALPLGTGIWSWWVDGRSTPTSDPAQAQRTPMPGARLGLPGWAGLDRSRS